MEIDVFRLIEEFNDLLHNIGLYDYGWVTSFVTDIFFSIVTICTVFAPLFLALLLIKWIVRLGYDN